MKEQEIEVEVKVIKIVYACPKCGNGNLLVAGEMDLSININIPHWLHGCSNKECDYYETFDCKYPKFKYVDI